MIHESFPWKQDLRRRLRLIEKYNIAGLLDRADDSAYTIIEKCVFYSAFIIRKLIECAKLSDAADRYIFHAIGVRPIKHIDRMHRWPDENSHDWEKETRITITGKDLCNWLIHSYVFFFEFAESGLISSFCISSDYDRNKILYKITLNDWISYMNYIASDDVTKLSMYFDNRTLEYVTTCKERGAR